MKFSRIKNPHKRSRCAQAIIIRLQSVHTRTRIHANFLTCQRQSPKSSYDKIDLRSAECTTVKCKFLNVVFVFEGSLSLKQPASL